MVIQQNTLSGPISSPSTSLPPPANQNQSVEQQGLNGGGVDNKQQISNFMNAMNRTGQGGNNGLMSAPGIQQQAPQPLINQNLMNSNGFTAQNTMTPGPSNLAGTNTPGYYAQQTPGLQGNAGSTQAITHNGGYTDGTGAPNPIAQHFDLGSTYQNINSNVMDPSTRSILDSTKLAPQYSPNPQPGLPANLGQNQQQVSGPQPTPSQQYSLNTGSNISPVNLGNVQLSGTPTIGNINTSYMGPSIGASPTVNNVGTNYMGSPGIAATPTVNNTGTDYMSGGSTAGIDYIQPPPPQPTAGITSTGSDGSTLAGFGLRPASTPLVSDENLKTNIAPAKSQVQSFLDNIHAHSYEYKDKQDGIGTFTTPMAQELEKTELGKQAVIETPRGKMVDYGRLGGVNLAAVSVVHRETQKLQKQVDELRKMFKGSK